MFFADSFSHSLDMLTGGGGGGPSDSGSGTSGGGVFFAVVFKAFDLSILWMFPSALNFCVPFKMQLNPVPPLPRIRTLVECLRYKVNQFCCALQ